MVEEAVRFLSTRGVERPAAGIILGSGLSGVISLLEGPLSIPYADIPGWPHPTAAGHPGRFLFGSIDGVPVAMLAGRAHLYEGYTAAEAAFGVRVLGKLGIGTLTVTNAAGAVNPAFGPGDLVLLSDHINLQGTNPLIGPNDDSLGPRFLDLTRTYSPRLRRIARGITPGLPEAVYAALPGPNYETPAEIRYLRTIGADLVGMSTVPEVIAARHMGIEVLAISCVTNLAAGLSPKPLSHDEVLAAGRGAEQRLAALLRGVLAAVARHPTG